jgi:hypothetical protein
MSDATAIDANPERQTWLTEPRPDPTNHRARRGLTHLLDTEDILHNRMTNLPCTHGEAAKLACALVSVRQQIRREQMKPDAKPIDVSLEVRRPIRQLTGPVEPEVVPDAQ